jgi:hypothetical protein
MSLSRFGLVTLVSVLTMISTDGGAIAAQSAQLQGSAGLQVAAASPVQSRPEPCCGTITGDS